MSTPDEQEQALSPAGDLAPSTSPEVPLEASEADVVEQAAATAPGEHAVVRGAARDLPLEVPEADAAEQAQVVPLDEDEQRG